MKTELMLWINILKLNGHKKVLLSKKDKRLGSFKDFCKNYKGFIIRKIFDNNW